MLNVIDSKYFVVGTDHSSLRWLTEFWGPTRATGVDGGQGRLSSLVVAAQSDACAD